VIGTKYITTYLESLALSFLLRWHLLPGCNDD